MRSGNAVSSHSGLIPSETAHEKRGGLLRPIARRKNLISLRSASFFTNFVSNLVHAYKFHGNLKIAFLKKLDNPEINHQFTCTLRASRFQGHWKQGRQWGFKCHKIFPSGFVFSSEHPHYSLALFSGFIFTCTTWAKKLFCNQKDPSVTSRSYWGVFVLMKIRWMITCIAERKHKCKIYCIAIYFCVPQDEKVTLQTLSSPFLLH